MTDPTPPWPQMRAGREVVPPPGVEWTPTPAPDVSKEPSPLDDQDTIDTVPMAAEPVRAATLPPSAPRTCRECGGSIDADDYCEVCGVKAPSVRDHYEESPASWVGGVCDRGVRHQRNEDALALSADPAPGSRAVLVVCDGVSSSQDSDVAALAGARRARDVLSEHRPSGMGTPASEVAAVATTLVTAAEEANNAVIEHTAADSDNAASCTFVAAVVTGSAVHHANIGDSRGYWVGDSSAPVLLTRDDSVAQARIAVGEERSAAESGPQAHAITKWLGRDSDDVVPSTGTFTVPGPGWVLLCSDGLWNYASEPADIAGLVSAALAADDANRQPTTLARSLVDWANRQGGKDNITVALARLGEVPGRPRPQFHGSTAAPRPAGRGDPPVVHPLV